jgi:hypothetical protein
VSTKPFRIYKKWGTWWLTDRRGGIYRRGICQSFEHAVRVVVDQMQLMKGKPQ